MGSKDEMDFMRSEEELETMEEAVQLMDEIAKRLKKLDAITTSEYLYGEDIDLLDGTYPFNMYISDLENYFKQWKKDLHIYQINLSLHENPNPVIDGKRLHVYSHKLKRLSLRDCKQALLDYVQKHGITKENFKGGEVYKEGEYIGYVTYEGEFIIKNDTLEP